MTLEERLAWREGRQVVEAESYQSVDQYDPVLLGHCRLEEEKADGHRMNPDARG